MHKIAQTLVAELSMVFGLPEADVADVLLIDQAARFTAVEEVYGTGNIPDTEHPFLIDDNGCTALGSVLYGALVERYKKRHKGIDKV